MHVNPVRKRTETSELSQGGDRSAQGAFGGGLSTPMSTSLLEGTTSIQSRQHTSHVMRDQDDESVRYTLNPRRDTEEPRPFDHIGLRTQTPEDESMEMSDVRDPRSLDRSGEMSRIESSSVSMSSERGRSVGVLGKRPTTDRPSTTTRDREAELRQRMLDMDRISRLYFVNLPHRHLPVVAEHLGGSAFKYSGRVYDVAEHNVLGPRPTTGERRPRPSVQEEPAIHFQSAPPTSRESSPAPVRHKRARTIDLTGDRPVESGVSAKKGGHGFVSTPAPVSGFMHDLLMKVSAGVDRPPRPLSLDPTEQIPEVAQFSQVNMRGTGPVTVRMDTAAENNFYLMPAVGAGDIPLGWIDSGRGIGAGGAFCEFSPANLNAFSQELEKRGFTLDQRADPAAWKARGETWDKLNGVLGQIKQVSSKITSLQRITPKDEVINAQLEKLRTQLGELELSKGPLERTLAKPLYFGALTKDGTTVHLFQGDSRKTMASSDFTRVLEAARRDKPVVAIENLPWGKNDKMNGETMSSIGSKILSQAVQQASPGTRSVFILDRTQLSAASTKTAIRNLWGQGALVRMFPMPLKTFPNASTSAAIFVVKKFDADQARLYRAVKDDPAAKKKEEIVRYMAGLLSAEDMRGSTLVHTGKTFTDSSLHAQNRVLSDRDLSTATDSSRTKTTAGSLLQMPGKLTQKLGLRVLEERHSQTGEALIDHLYKKYQAAAAAHTSAPSLETQARILACQCDLMMGLQSFTAKNSDGNVIYQPQSYEQMQRTLGSKTLAENDAAITHAIRQAAVIHRLMVPSFVTAQLGFMDQARRGGTLGTMLSAFRVEDGEVIDARSRTSVSGLEQTMSGERPDENYQKLISSSL